jgi:nitrite reductase/ring-hydroxylating ferredoxin subunit
MSTQMKISMPLSELGEGKMQVCSVGAREIVVCRTKEGIYALDNICTHAYARLNEGRLRGTRLICPLHGASFDIRDGRALGAPASRPLATHGVQLIDDRIDISIAPEAPPPNSL